MKIGIFNIFLGINFLPIQRKFYTGFEPKKDLIQVTEARASRIISTWLGQIMLIIENVDYYKMPVNFDNFPYKHIIDVINQAHSYRQLINGKSLRYMLWMPNCEENDRPTDALALVMFEYHNSTDLSLRSIIPSPRWNGECIEAMGLMDSLTDLTEEVDIEEFMKDPVNVRFRWEWTQILFTEDDDTREEFLETKCKQNTPEQTHDELEVITHNSTNNRSRNVTIV